ncbi:MAG: aldehyde ferredoxin oxidoreductase [Nitrososphaeria archaeon]|nr:aldehyde ferredoxin oxidoreductase [Nitrososphaeria archaeon]NIQ34011.1 aldehyde ferredoxin oxidoreductase [Nitrososphaeria archaeon]
MKGFRGQLLRVDLEKKVTKIEAISNEDAKRYLGGRGLGAKILYQELKPGIDSLGPENKLLFMAGPLVGVNFPGHSRYCVITKSPLTGYWGESHAAGYFGPQLKWSGFDGIILEGVAESPIYLWVHDGEAEIREAGHLWGKTTHETEAAVKKEVKQPAASVASIGIAGEKMVRFASIISDLNRAAGRTGVGAVMGSKRVKAIAVYGRNRSIEVADREGLRTLMRDVVKRLLLHEGAMNLKKFGTSAAVALNNQLGILPTKNFNMGFFEGAEVISGETMTETMLKSRQSCYGCPLACIRLVEVREGPYAGDFRDGPEYETLASLGSFCMNDDLASIAMANHLCNLHSLDTISTGVVIAFAMECCEKGIITEKDMGGISLSWGNGAAIIKMIEKITHREGVGDLLAEGVMRAAEKLGQGAQQYAMHVKGLEIPMHEPRGKKGLGLAYATSSRGAVHLDGPHDTSFERDNVIPELGIVKGLSRFALEGKAEITKKSQDLHSVINSLIICRFTSWPPYRPVTVTDIVNITRYVTGWDFTVEELMKVGERGFNLSRVFNLREGATKDDDTLPQRFTKSMPTGASSGQTLPPDDLKEMLEIYYGIRGWDVETGVPTETKLRELDLNFTLADLKNLGKL